ncbi:eukaryotic translation initiation factor 4 gamma 1-like [Haliotis asinina]|uniref:eukaryotic translation initiation factor 4 gamma 1-like n=1 Tax=Haliotis asinina TaxID=109174 RepID=UPI003531806B
MNVQKGKPSVSPPVQIATQPQHLGIASAPPTGHTPPLLRTEEIQIFQQPSYAQVQSYQVTQAPVPHDMNKQQPVAAGLMPAPGVAPQQQGIFQQQQAGLRTTQSPQYFPSSQPQGMRPPRYMGPQPQPNLTYQMYGPYMGQTQGQGYPAASVMVQQQGQLMYPPNTRMPTPQYHHAIPNSQTTIQQQMAATAPYQNPPTAQYGSAPQFQVYYQAKAPVPVDIPRHERGQTVPIAQPQRPTSASGIAQATLQKRVRNPIPIIDPNSGQQVQTEAEAAPKTTPPGGSARSTPVGQPAPESSPPPTGGDIAAQFAAQVAATLRSGHPPSSHTTQGQDMTASSPPLSDQQSYSQSPELAQPDFNQEVQETRPQQNEQAVEDVSSNAQIESGVDEPLQQVPVHEPSVKEATPPPETSETEVIGSSVDYAPEPSQVMDQSSPVDADSFTEPFRVDVENITPFVPAASQAPVQAPTPVAPVQAPTPATPVQAPVPEPPPVQAPVQVAVVQEPAQMAPQVVTPPVTETQVTQPTQPEVVEKATPPPPASASAPTPAPAVVSVADMAKEQTPPPVATESKEFVLDNEPASAGNLTGKDAKQKGGKKKLRDLNRKGDEKEGTDMDAFLDAENAQSELKGDEVKEAPARVEEVKTEVKIPPAEPVNNVADVGKENKMPNVEIEIKNSEESEVSRKNAKNEEKTNEVTTTEENSVEKKQTLKYKYKEDQWSPLNPEGKMTYDREFLLQLQYSKDSMKKPDSLPNFPEIIPDKPPKQGMDMRGGGGGGGGYGHVPDFTPGFLRPSRGMGSGGGGGGGGSGGGSMGKRGSQQRNRSDVRVIKNVSIQLDVKLHHSENAWKPTNQKSEEEKKSDEFKTNDLYRKVRSILNKLTPQKFQTLIKQVQNLVIDTEDRLKGVTDIIFEKAISEPAFSVAYANMCRYLLTLKVPSDSKQGETVNFRVILLTRCQREFEKDNDAQVDLDRRKKAIEEADPEKKKELKEELEIAATTARRRSIGNIRFIGELFKLKMLTENIMHDCVFKLLRSRDEENLECLCRLLTTIGKELESDKAKPRMDQYFQQMKKIVAEKKVSSRCRFMLQDVIELRDNNWKPRRGDDNPKTIDQIHKDAKREAVEQNMLTALHMANQQPQQHHQPRHNKPTRGRPGQGGGGSGGNMEEGWNTVSSKAIRNIDRNIDVSKLRIEKNADENIQLGPARSFGGWGRGSSGGGSRASKEGDKPNAPGNRFSALSREDDQRSRAFGRGVSPARGDGRNRANTPGAYNRGKVINRPSQESERERAIASARSIVSGRATPPSGNTSREGSRTRSSQEVERPAPSLKELSEEEMEKKTYSIVDEYLHIQDRKEAIQCVQELNSPKTIHFFVYFAINHVLERSKQARQQTGHLLHDLINQKIISVDTYLQGLTEILQSAEDMEIDIPKIWQYLGELIGPMIQDGSVPLSFLKKACEPLKPSGKAGNLMAEILHDASQRLGHKIVTHLWRNNCMDWSFFVPQEKIQQFLKEKNLEFTVGPDSAPSTPTSKVSIEWIKQNLSELLQKPKCDNEQIFDWIEANVPDEITKENRFIRALMTTVCSSAIVGTGNMTKVDQEPIKKWRSLLQKYLDHQPVFELQALYALQALVHSLEYPSGVLRTFFDTLYDEEIISEDAFNQWETSKEEQEGKGVALKQVVQFFAWLREGEEEEADS